jgi:glucosamine 6-phosphate synthetase-like amidotransferase/phosphosugar isomerase protein
MMMLSLYDNCLIFYKLQLALDKINETITVIEKELLFKIQIPKFPTSFILVGDLIHEIIFREAVLKISETCYYFPVRGFGLEEFLHGLRVTLDRLSSL